jgi:hypothetical protein
MKKLSCVVTLLLIILLGYRYDRTTETGENCQAISLNTIKNNSSKNCIPYTFRIASNPSTTIRYTQKRKITKGVKQTIPIVSNDTSLRITILENKPIIHLSLSHNFESFSGNGKRGPPSIYLIS